MILTRLVCQHAHACNIDKQSSVTVTYSYLIIRLIVYVGIGLVVLSFNIQCFSLIRLLVSSANKTEIFEVSCATDNYFVHQYTDQKNQPNKNILLSFI